MQQLHRAAQEGRRGYRDGGARRAVLPVARPPVSAFGNPLYPVKVRPGWVGRRPGSPKPVRLVDSRCARDVFAIRPRFKADRDDPT